MEAEFPAQPTDRCRAALTACAPCGKCQPSPAGQRDRGASVTTLSHSASFPSRDRHAPPNRGIKHLATVFARWSFVAGGRKQSCQPKQCCVKRRQGNRPRAFLYPRQNAACRWSLAPWPQRHQTRKASHAAHTGFASADRPAGPCGRRSPTPCCSGVFPSTPRMVGLRAAFAIASASAMPFFRIWTGGLTTFGAIRLASCLKAKSVYPQETVLRASFLRKTSPSAVASCR